MRAGSYAAVTSQCTMPRPPMDPTPRRFFTAPRSRVALLAAALIACNVAQANLAFAQPKGSGAAAKGAAAADEANTKKGIDLYKKGQALHKSGKFADALVAFRESNKVLPSPNTRLYIARCLAGSGDLVAAYLEFEGVIADAKARNDPKYDGAIAAANTERDEITTKLALVTVTVSNAGPNTRVAVGGKDIPQDQWGKPMPYAPGSLDVSVTTPPAPSKTQVLDLKAGEKRPVALDAAPPGGPGPSASATSTSSTPSSSRAGLRPISYAALGVGVAGMAVFGVAGVLANLNYSELDEKCGKGVIRACPSNLNGKIEEGKTEALAANIGVIVGGVGLAAGVTLFILSYTGGPKKDDAPKAEPVVGPGYLGVRGTF